MSFLDKTLIDFAKKSKPGTSGKDRIKVTEDLKIKKVAFDMVKVYGDEYNDLWKVESTDDGDFLVRSSNPSFQIKESSDWKAVSDFDCKNITLSYRGVPIARFASDEYSFSSEDIGLFKEALLERAADDGDFVKQVFANQSDAKRIAISNTFPELKDIIK